VDRGFRLKLRDPEPSRHRYRVFLVLVVPQTQSARRRWELISGKDSKLGKASHGMTAPAVVSFDINTIVAYP
jgi:hypothetical protein